MPTSNPTWEETTEAPTWEETQPEKLNFEDLGASMPVRFQAPAFADMSGRITTAGGGRVPVASYAETMAEPSGESIIAPRPQLTEPRVQVPRISESPSDTFAAGFAKEAYSAAASVPEFFTSDAGILSMMAARLSPRLVSAGFSADLTKSAFQQAKDSYANWDKMTAGQKGKAIAGTLASLVFGVTTGAHAAGKLKLPDISKRPHAEEVAAAQAQAESTPITAPAGQMDLTSAIAQEPAIPIQRPAAPVIDRPTAPVVERPAVPTEAGRPTLTEPERPAQPEAAPGTAAPKKGRGPYRKVGDRLVDADGNTVDAEGNILPTPVQPATGGTIGQNLVAAIRLMGGKIVVGKPGEKHDDIIKRENLKAEDIDRREFVDQKGNELSREQAAAVTQLPTETEAGKLHSTDLPKAKTGVREIALEEQRKAGWDSKWPFVPQDFANRDFRAAIEADPAISAAEKNRMFAAAEKLLDTKIERQLAAEPAKPPPSEAGEAR